MNDADIDDYAIIGDCRTAALVSRSGSVDWLCFPHFSGPSVFAALLDADRGGRFAVSLAGDHRTTRRYVGNTAVLETTFETASGTARLLDCMILTDQVGLQPMRELLRVVEGCEGEVELEVRWEPRPDYARAKLDIRSRRALGWACAWSDELFLLSSEAPLDLAPGRDAVVGRIRVRAGEKVHLSLAYAKADIGVIAPLGEAADARLRDTLEWWDRWSGRIAYVGPFREAVVRSAVTLKLLTFAQSGAVVAALTTSLPEAVGAELNWDYRYCWLRDATLTMRAFTSLGFHDEAASFMRWLLHATRLTWPKLQVMYDVHGRTNLEEFELDHLAGWRGSRPVLVGNKAYTQAQLDVYGGVVAAALDLVEKGGALQEDEARLLEGFGKVVCETWQEPDSGLWESRGPKRQYTWSKVMCWAALDSLVKLQERGVVRGDPARFREGRDVIAREIERRGFNEALGSYVSELDGDHVDAALLLMNCIGYADPGRARLRGTLDLIERRLARNGLLSRYERDVDDVAAREGAFAICNFWAVENLADRGDIQAAGQAFERMLRFANDVGLYAEELDPGTGKALGNFPQAFTHIGLINAATRLAAAQGRTNTP